MTDHDITEIADARYMGLMRPPALPERSMLVADIITIIIEQAEQRQIARKAKDKAALMAEVRLIVGELLIAMEILKDQIFRQTSIEPRLKVN